MTSHDSAAGGFTLVELLVSVLVLSIGLLALTGASAVIARQINGGAQMSLAASLARSRFEQLRASECTAVQGGASTSRGIAESWTVAPVAAGIDVVDTITFRSNGTRRVYAFQATLPCAGAAR